ncbi:MAG: PKD domain-containing protein [Dehalococcoidia bacterium]|nr:PKD domain-containing protein [Dehalococcoidia bacterium]
MAFMVAMNKRNRLIRLSNAFRGLLALVLMMSFLALPSPVAADTTTLIPNAAGSSTQLSRVGAASNWQACTSDDGDTSYVYTTNNNYRTDLYNLSDVSLAGTINSVTVYIRARANANPTQTCARTAIRTGTTDYFGPEVTLTTSYAVSSTTYTTNPGGGNWTWAQINALQAGARIRRPAGRNTQSRVTQVWVVVDYTPPLPDANFTASPTSGCTTLEVTFTDASTGNPITWNWNFPGGNPTTATGQGPHTIIYNSAGSYNVSLTVTNAYGPDTETKTGYITVNQTPTVTISGNPNICGTGNSTILTANATGGTQPYAYDWSPSTATGTASNNTFTATGAGTVAVAVTDSLGCTGRAKTIVAIKSPPAVNLSGNLTFCEGSDTTITANVTGGTQPYTYDWSDSTAAGSYVDNTYTATDSGTVAVTVTDSATCRGVVISDRNTLVTQGNVPGASHPYNAVLAWVHGSWWGGLLDYTFDYSADPDHPNTAAQWIWETYHPVHPVDGDIVYFERSFDIPGTPTGATIYMTCDNGYEVHINGTYLGQAQLEGDWEHSDLREPYVDGDNWQSVETWPVAVGLLNSGTNILLVKAANEQLDGGTPTGNPGGLLYEVTYEYTYDCGCTDTDSVEVTMNPAPEATASSNSPVAEGATIELYGGPNGMSSYSWSGPDGFSSPNQNPTIPNATTAMSGNYTLTVTDGNGCHGEASTYVEVTAVPTIDIEIYATQDCSGLPVTSMDPQTVYYARASVTLSNNLSNLQTVRVTLFHDGAGTDPLITEPVTGDTQTCAILTCTVGTPPIWSIEPNNNFPNPLTTWAIMTGECLQPSLNATSGDWIFAFMPGKVATETPSDSYPNADWDVQGLATNNSNQSGEIYVRDKAMNWYGEITVPASVDWGEVPLGLTFEDVTYNPETLSINYIANGNYYEDISTTEYWTGDGETVTLDASGGNPPTDPDGRFALKADNIDVLTIEAQVVTTEYKHINASGSLTGEAGVTVGTNSLWLSLSEIDVAPVVYSGSIYFQIAER